MPVIINEIEVLEPTPPPAAPAGHGAPAPPPPIAMDAVVRLLRDLHRREQRLIAD